MFAGRCPAVSLLILGNVSSFGVPTYYTKHLDLGWKSVCGGVGLKGLLGATKRLMLSSADSGAGVMSLLGTLPLTPLVVPFGAKEGAMMLLAEGRFSIRVCCCGTSRSVESQSLLVLLVCVSRIVCEAVRRSRAVFEGPSFPQNFQQLYSKAERRFVVYFWQR